VDRVKAAWTEAAGHWLVRLVLFGLPPLLVLLLMNAMWTWHVANIGCIGSGGDYQLNQLYSATAPGAAGCRLPAGSALSADDSVKVDPPGQRISPPAAAGGPAGNPPPVAIAKGRFHWMTFHLVATVLFVVIAAAAVLVIGRNLGGLRGWFMIAAGAVGGFGWAFYSLGDPTELRMDTASLLVPTRLHALSRFDAPFQELAWNGVRWDYGGGLAVTILVVVAAASILADSGGHAKLSRPQIEAKRRDLKLIIALAAILMTFLALYVGEWLAWPAYFAPAADVRGSREEFREVATGLRLYFGTGYSLALIVFAVPAVLALPRGAPEPGPAPPPTRGRRPAPTAERDDGQGPEKSSAEGYFQQFVFSKDELSMLISVMTPFLATVAGGALQI
jgi:hypothetical protein